MNGFELNKHLLTIGELSLSRGDVLLASFVLAALVALLILISLWRGGRRRLAQEMLTRQATEHRSREAEFRMEQLLATQSELGGRLAAMQENVTTQQSAFSKKLDERLEGVSGRVSQSLSESTKNTQESLAKLQERLAVIDTAQNNIQTLAQDVVGLQAILQNKQTRGAFGQSRMEVIVQDGLPLGAFEFQATLSNGKRPDCTISMPNDAPALVVDAKFPLEAWNAIQASETADDKQRAAAQFKRDIEVHIKDISEKYLIPGETQDTAFMFVPSESIFAEVHEHYESVIQKAHKARVVIVSPSLLLLSIQVIQAILKDARMREQAHLIQGEVMKFMGDLNRLDERVRKLQGHFNLTAKDIDNIIISTDKLTRHGAKIEALEFGEVEQTDEKETKAGKPFCEPLKAAIKIGF